MQAIYLIKNGPSSHAFEWRTIEPHAPADDEVTIITEAAGINFADISARLGNYKDCPPLPAIIGYEVVGRVSELGKDVKSLKVGERVIAFTRFGGYSQWVCQKASAVVAITEDTPIGEALALATQYCTAYYASHIATNVLPNERALIHAAAGGVGTALVQLCKLRGAFVYGTASSDAKLEYMSQIGVDVPINYIKSNFESSIKEPIDIAFDAVGADNFRRSYKLLNRGGRIVGYGAASFTDATNVFSKAKMALEFGIYHPAQLLMECKSIIGVNMLRIADYRPDIIQYCLQEVVELYNQKKIKPIHTTMYAAKDLAQAHSDMESRKTIGKIGIYFE
ncbi:MAG TPA: zinc-binding dehydrogenase [Chitinophagales bacterium]|nr:zinc-binding dehydrogenase [Chitinophagales bacterium]